MPRIAGINIPDNKRIEVSLTYIYGIGQSLAKKILIQARINPDTRAVKLNPEEMNKLKVLVEKHRVEGELKRDILFNIKRLKEIGCYRGVRHIKGLPVRGQRTKTNARTLRGARKTVSSGRKRGLEKT